MSSASSKRAPALLATADRLRGFCPLRCFPSSEHALPPVAVLTYARWVLWHYAPILNGQRNTLRSQPSYTLASFDGRARRALDTPSVDRRDRTSHKLRGVDWAAAVSIQVRPMTHEAPNRQAWSL